MRNLPALLLLPCVLHSLARAGADAESIPLTLELRTAAIGATLLLPRAGRPYLCAILVGGTLSNRRDGELERPGAPPRQALKRLAETLAAAGYGSFRYDQVGHGQSRAKPGYRDLYQGDAQVLAEIYSYLRGRPECSHLVAIGESAGAYVAALAARAGAHADAYVFLGAFCGQAEEIFSYNYGRFAEYVDRSQDNAAWARRNRLDRYLAYGRLWPDLFAAARAGKDAFELSAGAFRETAPLARRREELEHPPEEMFAFIRRPSLALAGTRDLNVPPHHAACAVAVMQRAGNLQTRSSLIHGADHNFQIAPNDPDVAFRERYTFASFLRPYHPLLDREILAWLAELYGRHAEPLPPQPFYSRAVRGPEIEPGSAVSPERFHLAPGVTIIDDILDPLKTPAVDTLEGRIGPLLRAPDMRAHFIDMPAGLYLDEHLHAKGSIIYTVRGRWALQSLGRWRLMQPGSLYWFGDNIPTGYLVPFPENAFILIFKAVPGSDDEAFMKYLREMARNLETQRSAGAVFRLADLPPSHPALEFARKVNPDFDRDFPAQRE